MNYRLLTIMMSTFVLSFMLKAMDGEGPIEPFMLSSNDISEQMSTPSPNPQKFDANRKPKTNKNKLRRARSLNDLMAIKIVNGKLTSVPETAASEAVASIPSGANRPKRLESHEVRDYLIESLGQEKAQSFMRVIKGKDKGEPEVPQTNPMESAAAKENLASLDKLQREEEAKNEKNAVNVGELENQTKSLSETWQRYLGKWMTINTRAARERENLIVASKAKAAEQIILYNDPTYREHTLEETRIRAQEEGAARVRTAIETTTRWINLIKRHPYILVGVVGGMSAGFFAAKHGMKVLFNEIQRIIGVPKLAHETSLLTFREKIAKALGLHKENFTKNEEVVFNSDFKKQINILVAGIANTVKNGGYFRNLLFYGVPGTGKTLAAKMIAQNSGLHFSYFAASSLAKMSEKDALNQVTELFDFAKRSPEKLMIIIDEAETLFADRGNSELDAQMKKILNLILTYTGTESKDYFVVAITNRPGDLDEAMLSRFARKLHFPSPNQQQVRQMLALYVKKFLLSPIVIKPTWYEKLKGKKDQIKYIFIEPGALNRQALDIIAQRIKGFVGRDITQLVLSLQAEAYGNDLKLTKKMVDQLVKQSIEEREQVIKNFKSE